MSNNDALRLYRSLPYRRELDRVEDGEDGTFFVCRFPELPGLSADGATPAEARRNADLAFDDYILAQMHWGFAIPKPRGAARVEEAHRQLEAGRAGHLIEVPLPVLETRNTARTKVETASQTPPSKESTPLAWIEALSPRAVRPDFAMA